MNECMVYHIIDMHMAEYYINIFFFYDCMNCFALPVTADYPAIQHALVNFFFLFKQVCSRRCRAASFFYCIVQALWMPCIIYIYVHCCRYPHSHGASVFCHRNQFHIAYYGYFFIGFGEPFIDDITGWHTHF